MLGWGGEVGVRVWKWEAVGTDSDLTPKIALDIIGFYHCHFCFCNICGCSHWLCQYLFQIVPCAGSEYCTCYEKSIIMVKEYQYSSSVFKVSWRYSVKDNSRHIRNHWGLSVSIYDKINRCWSCMLKQWKESVTAPICKKGDKWLY